MLVQLIDAAGDLFHTVLQNLFGDFFLVNNHRVLDRTEPALQVLANGQNLQDHDGRARKRLELGELPALDALGNLHFLFAREQRRSAHLTQVHPHRIGGRIGRARSQIKFDLIRFFSQPLFQGGVRRPRLFEHVQATRANAAKQIVYILSLRLLRNQIVSLVVNDSGLAFIGHQSVPSVVHGQVECLPGAPCVERVNLPI